MNKFNSIITGILVSICLFVLYANADMAEPAVDINLRATYSGPNTLQLQTDIQERDGIAYKIVVDLQEGLSFDQGALYTEFFIQGKSIDSRSSYINFQSYNQRYSITMEVKDMCEDCPQTSESVWAFYLITLAEGPLVLSSADFYEKMINEPEFAGKLGYIVTESKIYPGTKGIMSFREKGLSQKDAEYYFSGKYRTGKVRSDNNSKLKRQQSTSFAASYQRSGSVTYYDHQYYRTCPVPRAEVALVLYYAPAWEEVWAYGTTDDNGDYSVTFTIPDGQSLVESLVGIQIYLDNQTDTIQVIHPTTGLYMIEDINSSADYDFNFTSAHDLYGPLRYQWAITRSVIETRAGGFNGGNVDVLTPTPDGDNYYTSDINLEDGKYTYWYFSSTAHELGHHVMQTNMGYVYGIATPNWQTDCPYKYAPRSSWGEGWAQFWKNLVSIENGIYNASVDSLIEVNTACTKTDSLIQNVWKTLWDLYDGSGDEPLSYWSKMDDALRSANSESVYEYIAALKNQYASQYTRYYIESAIQLNLFPSPGLLLASAESKPIVLPKALNLAQNYPNPFNPSTSISFYLPEEMQDVQLVIYDIRGNVINTLVKGSRDYGTHTVFWDGSDNNGNRVSSGVYFYRLQAGNFSATRKMIVLK